ncbi:MAG: Sec-independent protein translocase protein TatB [Campylobacterota bacterium]|nr:Sec-independent protein translocase protein TatB [Campylobacterota bacterium]
MFGLGFTEIMIIAVIAILFLGPDKLPSAMVEVAKFFKNAKSTIGNVKDSLEQEINVSEIKEEALAYKKELLDAQEKLGKVTEMADVKAQLTNLGDDLIGDIDSDSLTKDEKKETPKPEKITFEKKNKIKEDTTNV